jgi:LysM repeat protein
VKGVLNMRMKKGIITITTIAVVILGVFFAVRFIGSGEDAANVKAPDDNVVQSHNAMIKDNNKSIEMEDDEDDEDDDVSIIEEQKEVENTNEMDKTYINDKTNVGIYTVKKNDTVFSIVGTHMPSFDTKKIIEFIRNRNEMDETFKIVEGQKIIIPYELSIETSTTAVSDSNTFQYIIKNQDTLTSIAKDNMPTYGIKHAIEVLKKTNRITDENAIKEGTTINIPK